MASMEISCDGCDTDYYSFIKRFHSNNLEFVKYLQAHGVLPTAVTCPNCSLPCSYRETSHTFRCGRRRKVSKSKLTRQCTYSVSLFKGSFLDQVHLQPWEIAIFMNHWLSKHWDHLTILECLKWSSRTSVSWNRNCSEVTENWLSRQEPIGGEGCMVDIDDLVIQRKQRKSKLSDCGKKVHQMWLFGGIERPSKKKFIIPLNLKGQGRSAESETLIPLIKRYILPGSVVISDNWAAYGNLSNEGYTHKVINLGEEFVELDHTDSRVHTQYIERLWLDIKELVKRPGNRKQYLEQSLSRYLFLDRYSKDQCHHRFFIELGRLYIDIPQAGDQQRPIVESDSSSSLLDTESDSDS